MIIRNLVIAFLTILFLLSCNTEAKITPMGKQELADIKDLKELSCLDYLRLCSSFDLIQNIFENKDLSISIFQDEISSGFDRPVIVLSGQKDFKSWISNEELSELKSLQASKQKCWPITNSYSSHPANYISTVGGEASFLLRLYEGKVLMTSNDRD